MSENRIVYNELCPVCKLDNREEKLFLDMDKVEYRCEAGHVFDELPSDTALRTAQEIQPETLQTELQTVQENAAVEAEIEAEPGANFPSEVPASETGKINTLESAILAQEEEKEAAARMAEIAEEIAAVTSPQVAQSGTLPPVGPGESIDLPNGDLLLGVVIPEAWRQAVEAEAQAQLKSPAAYFADWLTSEEMKSAVIDWLQNYWVSTYTQTV